MYRNISSLVFGNKQTFSLQHRVLNVATVYSGTIAGLFSLVNFALGLDFAYALLLPASALFFVLYGCSRFSPYFMNRSEWLAFPAIALMLLLLSYLWIVNAGSQGGSQYFFFLAASAVTVLFRGPLKAIASALVIAVVVGLIWFEHTYPEQIVGYENATQRYHDIIASFSLALLFFVVIIASITRNYEESFRKVERVRLHFSEDLGIAKGLQKRIYESEVFDDIQTRYDLALKHVPSAELSGDLYDLSEPGKGVLRVFLADARGHGINASLSAMLIKSEWNNLQHARMSPARALQELNAKFFAHYGDSVGFSAVIADLHVAKNRLVYASAGHDLQYILKSSGNEALASSGPPIGILDTPTYEELKLPFGPHDRLLLYTDALCEELDASGKPVGSHWFLESDIIRLRPSAYLADALIRGLARLRGRKPDALGNTDDLTIIVVGLPAGSAKQAAPTRSKNKKPTTKKKRQ